MENLIENAQRIIELNREVKTLSQFVKMCQMQIYVDNLT